MAIAAAGEPTWHSATGENRFWRWLRGCVLGMIGQLTLRAEQSEWSAEIGPRNSRESASIQTERAKAPDISAFDEFYTQHEQALYGYLRRLTASHDVALELAQETFVRAWRHFDRLAGYDRPEAWLFRVATNLAMSHLRRKRPVSLSILLAPRRQHDRQSDEAAQAHRLTALHDIERETIERDTIGAVLRALPERQRAALLLAAQQGFTADQIGEALGVSPANARQILSRARAQFRQLYDETQRSDA